VASFDVTLKGSDRALKELGALPGLTEQAGIEAANVTAKGTRQYALKLTTQRYNLDVEDLEPFIALREATTPRGGASVTLKARAIPISAFKPQVRIQSFRLVSRGNKPKTYTRRLPTIYVQRFRSGSPKHLHPYFPLHQRTDGALSPTDRVRRLVASKGKTGDYTDRLTGVRYYTFPKRFLNEIRPKLAAYVGERGSVELNAAFRKRLAGQRVLRGA
jgi:hypothetical protein